MQEYHKSFSLHLRDACRIRCRMGRHTAETVLCNVSITFPNDIRTPQRVTQINPSEASYFLSVRAYMQFSFIGPFQIRRGSRSNVSHAMIIALARSRCCP
jgi:hypothetical protein